jgi:CubicO group peptidase (beta-lactamase class C family)
MRTPTSIASRWISACLYLILTAVPGAAAGACAQSADLPESRAIDGLLSQTFRADQPGASAIVIRRGQVLLRKGYGMADMELTIPIEPDMVFRLGSVTKQFTAVAILMLEEQGKLSVQDPITRFLPDYPTQGHTITVENLLTHTSGIRSYTSMPEWQPLWRKDFSLAELIDILLGAIIEKASGLSYEDFLRKNIFEPLQMNHSYYDRTERIIPRRVKGYQRSAQGFENAPYLSMTQPYAAGSLASSVDDLATWNRALWQNRLLKRESLAKAHKPFTLKDGRSTGYGYGWTIASYAGHRTVEHGGGIHGFATYVLSMPDDDVFVAILTNGSAGPDASPGRLAVQMAGIAVGAPVKELTAISLRADQLDRYTGVYLLEDKSEAWITRDGNQLYVQRQGGSRDPIQPLSETEFFFPNSFTRLVFAFDSGGRPSQVELRPRAGMPDIAVRTDKPLPSRKVVEVSASILQKYTGDYELAPNIHLTVSLEDGKLMTQATGQPKVQVFPESETKFFLKTTDAQIEFILDASGKAASLKLYQGGRVTQAKKVS